MSYQRIILYSGDASNVSILPRCTVQSGGTTQERLIITPILLLWLICPIPIDDVHAEKECSRRSIRACLLIVAFGRRDERDWSQRFRNRLIIFTWLLRWDDSSMSPLVWYHAIRPVMFEGWRGRRVSLTARLAYRRSLLVHFLLLPSMILSPTVGVTPPLELDLVSLLDLFIAAVLYLRCCLVLVKRI
jgi:hypothetical protein